MTGITSSIAYALSREIQRDVYKKQRKLKLPVGALVRRNDVVYRVVGVDGNLIEVSDTKTPAAQTAKFNLKTFLSKHVELLGEEV